MTDTPFLNTHASADKALLRIKVLLIESKEKSCAWLRIDGGRQSIAYPDLYIRISKKTAVNKKSKTVCIEMNSIPGNVAFSSLFLIKNWFSLNDAETQN